MKEAVPSHLPFPSRILQSTICAVVHVENKLRRMLQGYAPCMVRDGLSMACKRVVNVGVRNKIPRIHNWSCSGNLGPVYLMVGSSVGYYDGDDCWNSRV